MDFSLVILEKQSANFATVQPELQETTSNASGNFGNFWGGEFREQEPWETQE